MNKNASAPLVIGGVSIGAIILLLFRLWATGLVIDAIEPEFEKALDSLGENVVCPPDFNSQLYDVCFNGKGNVIVTGKVSKSFSIETDSGDKLVVNPGDYDGSIVGTINNLEKASSLLITGQNIGSVSLSSLQLIKYSEDLLYLKKPLKTGFLIFKKIKYIPF
jgi:hypothetical protein